MSSQENNIIFQKTSFLSGTNSSYIEKLYAKYVENPASIPDSWRQFFEGLGDQKDNIIENQGPSWAPSNIKYISNGDLDVYEKYLPKNLNGNSIKEKIIEQNKTLSSNERVDVERSTIDSVRAIMMIRALIIMIALTESIVDLSTSTLSLLDKVLFCSIIFSLIELPFKFLGRYFS